MKSGKSRFALAAAALALVLGCGLVPAAEAHSHWSVGLYLGPGYWYYPSPWVYQPPYPAYAPQYYPYYYPYYAPPAPPVYYIERSAPPAPPPAESWWNYCPQSKAYYPYVRECPGGWQRVAPVPQDR